MTDNLIIDTWSCISEPLIEEVSLRSQKLDELDVKVYPNPSRGVFHLKVDDDSYEFDVYNLRGEKMAYRIESTGFTIVDAVPGVYVLRVKAGEMIKVIRLLQL